MSVNILVLPVPAQVFVRDREPISVSAVHGGFAFGRQRRQENHLSGSGWLTLDQLQL